MGENFISRRFNICHMNILTSFHNARLAIFNTDVSKLAPDGVDVL